MLWYALANQIRLRDGTYAVRSVDYPECEGRSPQGWAAREEFRRALRDRVRQMIEKGEVPILYRLLDEAAIAGKWLQMLKDIGPHIRRAALMFNPNTAPGGGNNHLGAFEAAARSLAVEPVAVRVRNEVEIDAAIASLSREQGCMVMSDAFMTANRATVISSAARNHVPVIADTSIFAREGGLISYGPSFADLFHRAAADVDRILRGAMPQDLPVQVPITFNLVINLRTARALGLSVPLALQATADELIE